MGSMSGEFTLTQHEQASEATTSAAMAVMVRAFDPAYGEAWSAAQLSGMVDLPGSWLVLAEADGGAVGFALVRAIFDEAELLLLGVDPDWRGRGIGRALLDHAVAAARSRGVRTMHLEVRANNPAAKLYSKAGFTHVNTRPDYYRGTDGHFFDALSYRLSI